MSEYLDVLDQLPFTFCWKIENFSMGMLFRKEWLYSSSFTVPYTNTSWKIMLHSNFVFKGNKYISLYLRRTSSTKNLRENQYYEIKLSIVGIDDLDKKFIEYTGYNNKDFDYWGSQKFISWNLLLKEKILLLPSGILTIRCVMKRHMANAEHIDSFLKCFHKLYDKEKRYPPQFKAINGQAGFERDEFGNNITGLIPNKYYVTPVLHKWFEYLYSEKLHHCHSFLDLQTAVNKTILENTYNWPNGIPEKFVLHSKLKTESTFFTWYIKEFSRLNQEDKFFSPAFRCGSIDWKLLFYLSEVNGQSTAEVFICPMSLYLNSKKIIKCRISVINRDGRLPLSQESVHLYDGNGHWRFPPFIQTEALNSNKESYLVNDILCLYCAFSTSEGKYECQQSWEVLEYNEKFQSEYITNCGLLQIREDMLYLFETGLYTDMIVKVGQTEIAVHKTILSERSPYFKYQIKAFSKVKGVGKITVEIPDLEEDTVRKLLKFIYSGTYNYRLERDVDLVFAVDEYGVCEEGMERCILSFAFRRLGPEVRSRVEEARELLRWRDLRDLALDQLL